MGCPRTAQRTEVVPTFCSRQWQAVGKHSILKDWQRFFCRCNQLRTYARAMPAAALTRSLGALWARRVSCMRRSRRHGKKSLLLVFVSVVAFATATPATSGPQCFFQGLGRLPGDNDSFANGVNANGKVVVGYSARGTSPP